MKINPLVLPHHHLVIIGNDSAAMLMKLNVPWANSPWRSHRVLCEGRPHGLCSWRTAAYSLSRSLEACPAGDPWDRGIGRTPGGWGHPEKGRCNGSEACKRGRDAVTWHCGQMSLSPGRAEGSADGDSEQPATCRAPGCLGPGRTHWVQGWVWSQRSWASTQVSLLC